MEKLYLIDASGFIYRSYFAIQNLTNSKGESTNALYGFARSVLKLIKDFDPTHMAAVFDGPRSTLQRTEIYADYKAHRKEMPHDLMHQIAWSKQFCQLMGIREITLSGVEADDTIGSIALWAASLATEVYLCTSDKDFCQLVNDRIKILNTHKDNLVLDVQGVEDQFGVKPSQIVDYLAITGDASDNVPGLPGFGPKTAADLLQAFGSLDYILDHPLEVPGKKKQETIIQEREKALLSRRLIIIDTQVPIPHETDFYKLGEVQFRELKDFYTEMNFTSLLKELKLPEVKPEIRQVSVECIENENQLRDTLDLISTYKEIALDVQTTMARPTQAQIVGIGFGVEAKKIWYLPFNAGLPQQIILNHLTQFFNNPQLSFYGHNLKPQLHALANTDLPLPTICFDTILASYLLNSHSRQHSLEFLVLENMGTVRVAIEEIVGRGKKQISMNEVPIDKMAAYTSENIESIIKLKQLFAPQLTTRGLNPLYFNLELPLMKVLLKMERRGIYIDPDYLLSLGKEVGTELHRLEGEITMMAGEKFNINSPKQLSEILFNKMGIKPPKKTATGFSTNADVLESLKHPLADKVLEYRGLEKLRSTYIDSLPHEIDPHTHRIHCSFNQVVAATGRLSSQDPNLQNIPVRTPIGRKIRHAFKPQREGWSFLAADYSQIELRLLAHLSEDPALIQAFCNKQDIHRSTAAAMFHVPLNEVTEQQRYQAKAVNFGIVYGQQAFGLSQELNVDLKTAANFIDAYFNRYQLVKVFLEKCKSETRKTGQAVTPTGRQRLIPEINSLNTMIRSAAERLAVNTPLQGMAADLIKMAMLEMDKLIGEQKLEGSMILQIHDELIFEVPDAELLKYSELVKKVMEGVLDLKVPLVVDIHIAKNWEEC